MMLLVAGLFIVLFIAIQRRWGAGVSSLPSPGVLRAVFSAARWLDLQSQREWRTAV